ncbi:unnamed protein product [Mytilus edulis]|uniref:CxC2-like cysteine cluster KDZ transposase-associated domain-containing protein n=1 Tax=Mytilus edulis TaxID=6550 RepID=A0A8S3V7E0_MYTED|nr:unnamed protein product [Mytilus edulis]
MPLVRKRGIPYAHNTYEKGKRKLKKGVQVIKKIKQETKSTSGLQFASIHSGNDPNSNPPCSSSSTVDIEEEVTAYSKAKSKRLENWEGLRSQLLEVYVSHEEPCNSICNFCGVESIDFHSFPHLHTIEKWMHGTFIECPVNSIVWKRTDHVACESNYQKELVIVDDKGRQHLRHVQFCSCEQEPITLLRFNLWPASPKHPRLAFHRQDLYKILMKETIQEFRHLLYKKEHPKHLCEKLDDGTECPACYNECNEFQAGNQLRSKIKNKKLSETAVFGSICRHEFPQLFCSLKHGERLGYSVFLIDKLLEKYESKNIHVMYDIACILDKHLKVLFNPRKTLGIGLTDGEGMERAKIDLYGENQAEKEVKRLEASLLKIEKKHKIQRWDQKCEDYTQFLKQANKQQKIKLLASLKQLVVERCFLLSLVKRYASMYYL